MKCELFQHDFSEAHSNGKMHMFLATIADGKTKQLLHAEKRRKLQNLNLSPIWDGPLLGGSLGAR